MMSQSVTRRASYAEMEKEVVLKDGLGPRYGLGVLVRQESGQRAIEHGGEVSGFTAHNMVFPAARMAVVVLVNEDSVGASGDIARKLADLLFREADAGKQEDQSREIFAALQQGKINRALFTDNCSGYFTDQALKDFAGSLGPLGIANRVYADPQAGPRGNDVPPVRSAFPPEDDRGLGTDHARR